MVDSIRVHIVAGESCGVFDTSNDDVLLPAF
jgi:hypothetical protein